MKRTISLILAIVLLVSLAGCSGFGIKEGEYEKLDAKLAACFDAGQYQEAKELMAAYEWYTVKDGELAQKILDGVEAKGSVRWLEVMGRFDKDLAPEIEERKNGILTKLGLGLLGTTSATTSSEVWSYCSEGSAGYDMGQAMTLLEAGEPLAAGKLLYDHMADEEVRERFEEFFVYDYLPDVESPDAQDHLERALCAAYIAHIRPDTLGSVSSLKSVEYGPTEDLFVDVEGTPEQQDYYDNIFEKLVMPEAIRSGLPQQISAVNEKKILVLDRVDICGKNETELYIDGYLMRRLPEENCAESLDEVRYILLLDYGYLCERNIWYAGTVTARIFDVQTGEEIFTSETVEGAFRTFYSGPSTDVIFGSYPDITDLVREAVSNII